MAERELYPIISDDEYRGKGFFEAVIKNKKFSVKTEDRTTYGASMYGGEVLILEKRNAWSYWMCAGKRNGVWRQPRPTYEPVYLRYIVYRWDIESLTPR
jgi:hypothetical protein